jgi:Ca-activated chloride channel family protein
MLQDEPAGVKECTRCGGGLEYESQPPGKSTYIQVQMELDQVAAPANQNVERYLLVTIRTPAKVPDGEAAASQQRPPVNFAAVLDVSGSMQGEKISQAKQAVERAVQYLHPGDVFSLVTFSNLVACPFEPDLVSNQTYEAVKKALRSVQAGGMTALCEGLETGIQKAQVHKQDSNLVLLLSDGQANVGETDLEKIGHRAYMARQGGSLVSCIGVGEDYNESLMAEIATQGSGRYYHIQNANQIPAYLAGELGEVAALAARETRLVLTIPAGATLIPLSATYPVTQAEGQAVVNVGDIPCDTELEIPLRLALLAQPDDSRLSIQGSLTFRSPAGHALECPVNRVTVRFIEQHAFQQRQGVVMPVAERVFVQLRAASVLRMARLQYDRPRGGMPDQAEAVIEELGAYAELLGKERAEEERFSIRNQFDNLADSPAFAKQAVASAYRKQRSSKDFH